MSDRAPRPLVALSTIDSAETAKTLADALVGEGLVACVNVVPGVTSVYRWQGEICHDSEWLLVMKTVSSRSEALDRRLRELHPYDVPELILLPIDGGAQAYLDWLVESCGGA
jgi:periplasmic divalent cation tolerance protein